MTALWLLAQGRTTPHCVTASFNQDHLLFRLWLQLMMTSPRRTMAQHTSSHMSWQHRHRQHLMQWPRITAWSPSPSRASSRWWVSGTLGCFCQKRALPKQCSPYHKPWKSVKWRNGSCRFCFVVVVFIFCDSYQFDFLWLLWGCLLVGYLHYDVLYCCSV